MSYKFDPSRLLSAKDFGARGDGVTDDTAALNTAFAYGSNNKVGIFIPAGVYKITSTLFATPVGSSGKTCHIVGAGRGYLNFGNESASASAAGQTIIDAAALTSVPAIVIQAGRGCYLGHLSIFGANVAPGNLAVQNMVYGAAWVTGGLRDSQYSPQCAINIDAGVGAVPPDGGYPGFTYLNAAGGSLDVVLDELTIWQFVVGIMHNAEVAPASQGDQVHIINPQIQSCKVGIAFGQSQSRACSVQGGNFNSCRTAYDSMQYGQQAGAQPIFFQTQFVDCFECFAVTTGFNPSQFIGCRAETVHRLGQAGSGASANAYPLILDGFDLHLLNPAQFPQARSPIVLEAYCPVEWIGGAVSDDGPTAQAYAMLGRPLQCHGTQFSMVNRFQPYIGGVADFNNGPCELVNCVVNDNSGNIVYGNTARFLTIPGRFSAHWSTGYARDANGIYQYQPGASDNTVNIGTQTAVAFTSTQLTFNNSDPAGLQVGDVILWQLNPVAKSLSGQTVPAAQITGIAGNAVTCALLYPLSYYNQAGSAGTTQVAVTEWGSAPGVSLVGTTTNLSNSITGVSPTNILQNGDWIAGTNIPPNTRVVSGAGTGTITISRNATGGGAVKLGWGGLRKTDGDIISADHGDASADLSPMIDGAVQLWNTPLTAGRTATLSPDATPGARFRVVRGTGATGAFNLNVGLGPLKALTAAGQWVDVQFTGSAWIETASGSL